jgi:hypothetical protein
MYDYTIYNVLRSDIKTVYAKNNVLLLILNTSM